jgi:hypothetical protein
VYVAAHDRIEELVERGLGTLVQRRMETLAVLFGFVRVCLALIGFVLFRLIFFLGFEV